MSDYQNGVMAESAKALAQQQAAGLNAWHDQALPSGIGNASPCAYREPVTRQDLIDMSLKLQEALSLVTQALGRMR